MNVFAKVCPKCKHVHGGLLLEVGEWRESCGVSSLNGLMICNCKWPQSMRDWL